MSSWWLLLAAYACSGAAGLIYEITWTRQLTLLMGHTTAAASTVLAAFMGGLAVGSAVGGRLAGRLDARSALRAYAGVELAVAVLALLVGGELMLLDPVLKWAYQDGAAPLLYSLVRLTSAFLLLTVPAAGLGATYPLALRWRAETTADPGRAGGALYAANTFGASLGALGAGFVLLPALGRLGTTVTGACVGALAAGLALLLARRSEAPSRSQVVEPVREAREGRRSKSSRTSLPGLPGPASVLPESVSAPRVALAVMALTGMATFMYEVAWTRVFALIVGPSTYAFSSTVAVVIAGTALGSFFGTALVGRMRRPQFGLVLMLALAALALAWATTIVGSDVPRYIIDRLTAPEQPFGSAVASQTLLVALLLLPVAFALGAAFPLTLHLVGPGEGLAQRVGFVYAVNTLGSVAGALAAGFVAIPAVGLQHTLLVAIGMIVCAALTVAAGTRLSLARRGIGVALAVFAMVVAVAGEPWDRDLLASGAYKYARYAAPGTDVASAVTAGSLVYYREGAVSTVSVKRLTGALSLSVDGKVDASTGGDMLTQKLLAHVPLLIHPDPKDVAIIGLGSGVTLASALRHPIRSADVIEISKEVVEASHHFDPWTGGPLDDPRTRLIVGDGRSHMLLASRQYDVIVSEPSNPWMAGVATLFTREFFTAMKSRLAPGGILCQWAHTYDITEADLRSIVATFADVFPNATLWTVGGGDLLLVAGVDPLDDRLAGIDAHFSRPGVSADLADIGVVEPFSISSLYLGSQAATKSFAAEAPLQTDDRMALEFSGPAAMFQPASVNNMTLLEESREVSTLPAAIARALDRASATEWYHRGQMLYRADAYREAFDDFQRALTMQPPELGASLDIVPAAVASGRGREAAEVLTTVASSAPDQIAPLLALSKLFAAEGNLDRAVTYAVEASHVAPNSFEAWEQLASIFADAGDGDRLEQVLVEMTRLDPRSVKTLYYTAASAFIHGEVASARAAAEEAVRADGRFARAHNLLGATSASEGKNEAARSAFTTALSLDPRDLATYMNLGMLEMSTGSPAAAVRWFAEGLSLDPASQSAREGLRQARAASQAQ